jgi:hypothetical protein
VLTDGRMVRWPEKDIASLQRHGEFHEGAAICRRGHVETYFLKPMDLDKEIPENCPTCGARVLTACPGCGLRIRGDYYIPGVAVISNYERPSFCDGCGSAFPWATREERIYELENLLDEEDIDEADRVVIQDQLQRLRNSQLSEREERQVWETIKRRAGKAITSGPVLRVVEGLVSAALRQQLGL